MLNPYDRTRHIVQFVEAHWQSGITVQQVAATFEVDASDAERLFRNVTGKTIARFVQERRKEYVQSELQRVDLFAYELVRELGYREEQSFTRWVKKAFGMSWTELCCRYRDGRLSLSCSDEISPPHSPRRSLPNRCLKMMSNIDVKD